MLRFAVPAYQAKSTVPCKQQWFVVIVYPEWRVVQYRGLWHEKKISWNGRQVPSSALSAVSGRLRFRFRKWWFVFHTGVVKHVDELKFSFLSPISLIGGDFKYVVFYLWSTIFYILLSILYSHYCSLFRTSKQTINSWEPPHLTKQQPGNEWKFDFERDCCSQVLRIVDAGATTAPCP